MKHPKNEDEFIHGWIHITQKWFISDTSEIYKTECKIYSEMSLLK